MAKSIALFDLDGTLALIDHRRLYLNKSPPDWKGFFEACVDDIPNLPIIETLVSLYKSGKTIVIASGRSASVEKETIEWLNTHVLVHIDKPEEVTIVLRKEGDFTPDDILKESWLQAGILGNIDDISMVFDDRDKVVAMWRNAGLVCCQVAPGNF